MADRLLKAWILAEWDWTSPELPVDSWWFFAVVLVLLMVFIWAIARLTTRTTDDIDPAEIDRQMLSAVSELRSQGELSPEEFRSIKSRLVERLSPDSTSEDPISDSDEVDGPNQKMSEHPNDTSKTDEELNSDSEKLITENEEDTND